MSPSGLHQVFPVRKIVATAVWMLAGIGVAPVAAQDWGAPDAAAPMRLGPVALNPTLSIINFGVDPNVFNSPVAPLKDLSAVVRPSVDLWFRFGRNWVSASHRTDYLHFNDFADQRTVVNNETLRVDVPFNRMRFYFGGNYNAGRDRPGIDIDERLHHTNVLFNGGLDARLGGRTILHAAAERASYSFNRGRLPGSADLGTILSHVSTGVLVGIEQTLTPLTSFVVTGGMRENTFDDTTGRDNTTQMVSAGFNFRPLALITGTAHLGILRIVPKGTDLPPGTGYAATVNLGYTLKSTTHFGVSVTRGVTYSPDPAVPYALNSSQTVTVDYRLTDRWSMLATLGHTNLSYRDRPNADMDLFTLNAGVGCRITRHIRAGIGIDRIQRTASFASPVAGYRYFRLASSFGFGL
jgi:hypothetical protein